MDLTRPRGGRERRTARRLALLAAAALATGVPAAPALAQQQPQQTLTVNAASDSVLATGLPYGATTVQVKRPDAVTAAPVVIGQFAGTASGLLPFSVNTTTPTAFNPAGDCWQSGALTLGGGVGLTPDIRPGDTVTVSGGLSLLVPANAGSGAGQGGPIGGCGALSAYGWNGVTAATGGSGTDLTVSGTAQPLATGVSVTATDGHATTSPVDASLADGGTWTATVPAAQLAALADGTVMVGGVYAVPDVSTSAPAEIAGAPLSIQNTTVPSDTHVPGSPPAPEPAPPVAAPAAAPAAPPAAAPKSTAPVRLTSIRATSKISLAHARSGGIRASFVVPAGARVVRVRLSRGKTTAYTKFVAAGSPGTRQTVHVAGAGLAHTLRRGAYALTATAGPSRAQLGPAITRTVLVR
jgi:hypothetical protein